ncbi:uncharacterized protein LOC144306156 isoform X6 [Canis aureus]
MFSRGVSAEEDATWNIFFVRLMISFVWCFIQGCTQKRWQGRKRKACESFTATGAAKLVTCGRKGRRSLCHTLEVPFSVLHQEHQLLQLPSRAIPPQLREQHQGLQLQ